MKLRSKNDRFFTNIVRRAIQIVILNYFRSTIFFFLFEATINELDFQFDVHDTKNRSTFVKSNYIINWTVNNIKLRRNIRAFLIINSLYVKFVTSTFIESNTFRRQSTISDIIAKKVIYRNLIDLKLKSDMFEQLSSTSISNVQFQRMLNATTNKIV